MAERGYERLLGGYATGTLTEEERRTLFDAALRDQELFNALADEQALKELLDDPVSRQRLLQALEKASVQSGTAWLTSVLDWFRRPANLGLAGSLATAVIALVVGITVYKEAGFHDTGDVRTADKRPLEQPPAELATPLQEEDALVPHGKQRKEQGPDRQSVAGKASTPGARARADEPIGIGRTGTEQPMAQRPKRQVSKRQAGPPASEEDARSRETPESIRRAPETFSAEPEPSTPQAPTVTKDQTTMASASQQPAVTLRGYFGVSMQKGPARDLFYAPKKQAKLKERTVAKQELAKSPSPTEPMRADAAREETKRSAESISEAEKAGAGAVTVPETGSLGLRYSILKRDDKGTYSEVDPEGPFRPGDALRLTVEVNAPGYLYVLQQLQAGRWMWLFPSTSSATQKDFARAQVVSRRRYIIPETGSIRVSEPLPSSELIILFSRRPHPELHALLERTARNKPSIDQFATDLDNLQNQLTTEAPTAPLQIEHVRVDRSGSTSEQALYAVVPNPTPDTVILTGLQFNQD